MFYSKKVDPSKVFVYLGVIVAIVTIIILSTSIINTDGSSDVKNGHRLVLVVSGSMEPTISVNSLSKMEVCQFEDINIGDIIMYKIPGNIDIAHRVIDKFSTDTEDYIITKGDNNKYQDNIFVTPDMVKGRIIEIYNWTAPFVSLIMAEPGMVDPIALGKVIIIAILVLGLLVLGIGTLGNYTKVVLKSRDTSDKSYYTKELNEYKSLLESRLRDFADIHSLESEISDLIQQTIDKGVSEKDIEGKKLEIMRLLTRGKMLDEMDSFLNSSHDMTKALTRYKRLSRKEISAYRDLIESTEESKEN